MYTISTYGYLYFIPCLENSQQYSSYILYSYISIVLTIHQGNFSIQQMGTIIENHSQSEFRLMEPSFNECNYETLMRLKIRAPSQHGIKKKVSQRIRDFSGTLYLQVMSETKLLNSPTWLSKAELNEDSSNKHAKLDMGEPRRPKLNTKNWSMEYWKWRNSRL